jgi:sec-independent protein translocase protein TatC
MPKQETVTLSESYDKYVPFLVEVRKRLMFLIGIFLVASILGFLYYEKIIILILRFLHLEGVNIVFTSPFQFFSLAINSGLIVGLVVTFPMILAQILSFIKPALRKKEYKLVLAALPLSIILFIAGFGFGVFVMRYVIAIFYQKSVELQIGNLLDIELLLSKIIVTGSMMGVAFQFPIITTVLMHLKVIKYKTVVTQRPLAYMTSVFFVLLLPPTDLMSDLFLTLPLVIMFELTLILNRLVLKAHLL